MTLRIGNLAVGSEFPCAVIAEIGNAHNGSLTRAFRLLAAAKDSGASAAKLQCYSVDELIALRGDGAAPAQWSGRTMRDLYSQAITPKEWFRDLYSYAADIGLPVFASVFGMESLALLESLGNSCYKISKFERHQEALVNAVVATGKPWIVSAPRERDYYNAAWADATLYCPGSYPCEVSDITLPRFAVGGGWFAGLSSHCLASSLPIASVARGAKILEYHFMLAEEPSVLEANVSLNQYQMRQLIRDVRECEAML